MPRPPRFPAMVTVIVIALALGVLLSPRSSSAQKPPPAGVACTTDPAQAYALGIEAYVWGYPLVVMMRTARALTTPGISQFAPVNTFRHTISLVGPQRREVVTANNDTIYSSAWLDLRREPLVLHVPDTGGRYYSLQILDAYTNTFASIGRRTTGTGEGSFVLTGPGWQGELPAGLTAIASPTTSVWIIIRILVDGEADLPAVGALQQQFTLTTLSTMLGTASPPGSVLAAAPPGPVLSPQAVVAAGLGFYDELRAALELNPPPPAQAAYVERFAAIGVAPGRPGAVEECDAAVRAALEAAIPAGEARIDAQIAGLGSIVNGWKLSPALGAYGEDYPLRAATAKLGLGALEAEEATYLAAMVDAEGQPLSGAHRYVLHFDAGEVPPVDAFWSLTLYDTDGFLVANPIDRYSIGDRTPGLTFSQDGSLEIAIQHEVPAGQEANWLPAPAGSFYLVLRLYNPRPEVLSGAYRVPPVRRVD